MRWSSSSAAAPGLDAILDGVVAEAAAGLDGARADAAFVFLGPDHARLAPRVRDRLRSTFPSARILGATALGVIGGTREHEQPHALAVTVAHLPDVLVTEVHIEAERLPSPDAAPSAWHAAVGVPPSPPPAAFVVVADPYSTPADALVAGLDFAYPSAVKVGGLASGASGPGEQVLFTGDRLLRAGAAGLAFSGDVSVVPAVAQGCRGFGPVMRITSCDGRLLRTLDGEPALDVVQRVLREAAERYQSLARTSALFFGIETDPFTGDGSLDAEGNGAWLVRNVLGRERDGTGIYVGETLRTGWRVRLHVRDRVSSVEDLERTLASRASELAGRCAGALLFSCLGRGMGLYGVPDHDTAAFHRAFADVPVGGFFCNGEIGPVGGTTHVHGFTSSFGLFAPKE